MKGFILKTTAFTLPLLLSLMLANYYGDAAHLFDNDYEKKMAEIIRSENFVTNISNYDERLFQKEFIKIRDEELDIVVLGSSRTMQITTEDFPKKTLVNNSVSGASIEDIIGIYQIIKENKKSPKKVVIGIDPWLFNENSEQYRWQSISRYYNRFKGITSNTNGSIEKYKELLSFSYFQESVKNLIYKISGSNEPITTTKKFNKTNTKLGDGSLSYGESYREISNIEVEKKAKAYILGEVYGIENFEEISKRIWAEFDRLVKDMKRNQIEVEFFLVPYHPLVYEKIKADYKIILSVENSIKNYAGTNNIKLMGSFDPSVVNMDRSYFYDGMHCKEKGIQLLLKIEN